MGSAGTHPNSKSNAPAENALCCISRLYLIWIQEASYGPGANLPRFPALLGRMNSVLDVTLEKGGYRHVVTHRTFENLQPPWLPTASSRKIFGEKLKPTGILPYCVPHTPTLEQWRLDRE